MKSLVALALPGGTSFVSELQQAWDAGDAVLPIDLRLPGPAREKLLHSMGASRLVDEHGHTHRRSGGRPVEDGDALVVATSGTTGEPKGVVLTHDAIRTSALLTSKRLAVTSSDHWLACIPLAHIGGLAVVIRALVTGTTLTVLPRFDAAAVETAAGRGATLVSLVTTALRRIDPMVFRTIVLGGAAAPFDRPANTVVTYGMTETGSGVVYNGDPLCGVDLRSDDGSQLWIRSPTLFRTYRDGTNPCVDGWFPTGDAGQIEPDGTVTVFGRMAEVIVTGGEKVWPTAVETIVRQHRLVRDAVVHGQDDPQWGQRVIAVIEPTDPDAHITLEALRDHVKAHLPAYAAPSVVEFVKALPRTSSGKVIRPTPKPPTTNRHDG